MVFRTGDGLLVAGGTHDAGGAFLLRADAPSLWGHGHALLPQAGADRAFCGDGETATCATAASSDYPSNSFRSDSLADVLRAPSNPGRCFTTAVSTRLDHHPQNLILCFRSSCAIACDPVSARLRELLDE
ncbi:MAG: hypothetical protein JSS87_11320 [Acidobacteria bacterium]|nr:hypothetical protein [Acidobacteriota bacterium]